MSEGCWYSVYNPMEKLRTTTVKPSQKTQFSLGDYFSVVLSPTAFLSFQHVAKNTDSFLPRTYAPKQTYLHINRDNNICNVCI